MVVAWQTGRRLWVTSRPPGGRFGAPQALGSIAGLSDLVEAEDVALDVNARGDAVLAWEGKPSPPGRQTVVVSTRRGNGPFSPPVELVRGASSFDAGMADDGEVLVAVTVAEGDGSSAEVMRGTVDEPAFTRRRVEGLTGIEDLTVAGDGSALLAGVTARYTAQWREVPGSPLERAGLPGTAIAYTMYTGHESPHRHPSRRCAPRPGRSSQGALLHRGLRRLGVSLGRGPQDPRCAPRRRGADPTASCGALLHRSLPGPQQDGDGPPDVRPLRGLLPAFFPRRPNHGRRGRPTLAPAGRRLGARLPESNVESPAVTRRANWVDGRADPCQGGGPLAVAPACRTPISTASVRRDARTAQHARHTSISIRQPCRDRRSAPCFLPSSTAARPRSTPPRDGELSMAPSA